MSLLEAIGCLVGAVAVSCAASDNPKPEPLPLRLSTLSLTVPGLVDRFDQPEILDDLHDGWMADLHQGGKIMGKRICLLMIRTMC